MSDDLLKEIQNLKGTLASLSVRLQQLEQRLTAQSPPPQISPTPTQPKPAPTPLPRPTVAAAPASKRESLETRIGRYWLNRVGMFSFVMGVAFFILYSFRYLGPEAKIAIGFAIGAMLLGLGVWLERKPDYGWYARGLLGGGWAVVYFTTYAMHHIPGVRILSSTLVDLFLLLAVTAGAVSHAITYRSQVITASAFLLGFITLFVSHVTYFTLTSSVLLVAALVMVTIRMRWPALCLYGVVGSHLTHLLWAQRQVGLNLITSSYTDVAVPQFWLNTGFLSLYWVAYTIGILALDERRPDSRNALLTATLANGLLFALQVVPSMPAVYERAQYLVLLGLGVGHFMVSIVAGQRGLSAVSTAQQFLGITFVTLAIPERLTDRWTSFLWTAEVASLAWFGLRYDRWIYRAFAGGLGLAMLLRLLSYDLGTASKIALLSWMVPWRMLIGLAAMAAFGGAAAAYRAPRYQRLQKPAERQAFHLYAAAACVVGWFLTAVEAKYGYIPFIWALQASTVAVLGWRLRDRAMRMYGAVWFFTTGLLVLIAMVAQGTWWNASAVAGVVALLYGMGLLYRNEVLGATFEIEERLRHVYAIAASVMLTWLLWIEVSRNWISLAWAVEGFGLLAVGFFLGDKVFRFLSLGVFGLLVLKILFVDLAGAETIYRILSFLVVGAILLLASFAYAKFSEKTKKP